MYFSSPVEPVRFQKLRIALTETTTYIQEYRSGKANIPSWCCKFSWELGAERRLNLKIDSNTRQRIHQDCWDGGKVVPLSRHHGDREGGLLIRHRFDPLRSN